MPQIKSETCFKLNVTKEALSTSTKLPMSSLGRKQSQLGGNWSLPPLTLLFHDG